MKSTVFFLATVLLAPIAETQAFCWPPGINPFTGPPKATRMAGGEAVRIDWGDTFTDSSSVACSNVDFFIKSHPRFQPAAYKLSDFTESGRTFATIRVDSGSDFVFQVIAREDKGMRFGIDYKYSPMVTSYAGDSGNQSPARPAVVAPISPPAAPVPQTRALPSIYDDYRTQDETASTTSWASVKQCLPILRKAGHFGPGSGMRQDRILINFVRYMNQRPVEVVSDFLQTKRSCKEDHKKGFLRECHSQDRCCATPWSDCDECNHNFAICDGRCIPQEWVSDGWPDCLDGSDEPDQDHSGERSAGYRLQCVHCAGVVLTAAHLCTLSGNTSASAECVLDMMGEGECNVCVRDFLN